MINISAFGQRMSEPTSAKSFLKTFLLQHNRLVKGGGPQVLTHVMMDQGRALQLYGGKVKVCLKDRLKLHRAIVDDLNKNELHPLVEVIPDKARLAVDWDLKTKQALTKTQKEEYTRVAHLAIRDTLKQLVGDADDLFDTENALDHVFTSIVCCVVGDTRECVTKEGEVRVKDGIHMTWPNLFVDHAQAKHLVNNVMLPALQSTYPGVGIDWGATLDDSIYNSGKGLRMCQRPANVLHSQTARMPPLREAG